MSVQWMTKEKNAPTSIAYKRAGIEEVWQQQDIASMRTLPYTRDHFISSVELTQLEPDTRYVARFKEGEKPFTFRTMPRDDDEPISFIDGGDMYHDDSASMNSTSMTAAAQNPRFVVIGGDIAYSSRHNIRGESPKKWISWLINWSRTMVSSEGDIIPIIPAIGNHEVNRGFGRTPRDARLFYTTFPLPHQKAYRVIDFGNYLSLFLLDSGHTAETGGAQRSWLVDRMAERQKRPVKMASYHVPAYPSLRKYTDKHSVSVREAWVPVFDGYGLDVAFEHHDHSFKRTHRLKAGKLDPAGTLYLGDGCWGIKKPRRSKGNLPYLARSAPIRHFFLITLHKKSYTIRAISDQGKVFDEVNSPATPGLQSAEQTEQTPAIPGTSHHQTAYGRGQASASPHSPQESLIAPLL